MATQMKLVVLFIKNLILFQIHHYYYLVGLYDICEYKIRVASQGAKRIWKY